MVKRGQLSILLVVALIIIILFSILVFLRSFPPKANEFEIAKSSTASTVYSNVQSCLKNTAEQAVSILGLQGGHIEKPSQFLTINNSIISFGYYKNSIILNSLEDIKSEINKYIEENLPSCTKENRNLIIEEGSVISKIAVNKDNLKVEVSYPIKIRQGDRVESLPENYVTEVSVRLDYLYNFLLSALTQHLKDPHNIDIANLLKSDLTIDIVGYNENILLYFITDKKSRINNKPFTFILANYFGT